MSELAVSIRQHGLLQPIAVRQMSSGYQLISGERRLRACRSIGLKTVSALVLDVTEQQAAMLTMIENLQREELGFFEEAEGYSTLICIHGLTQREVAEQIGKKQSTVANKLRLLQLSPDIRTRILHAGLSERHARCLLRLKNDASRESALDKMIARHLSVRQSEELIEGMLQADLSVTPRQPRHINRVYADWRLLNNSIKSAVGHMRDAGIPVKYTLHEEEDYMQATIIMPKRREEPITFIPISAKK